MESTKNRIPEKVTLDGVEYETETLSELAKFCLSDIDHLDQSIITSQRDIDLLEAAKEKITQALEQELS